MPSHYVVYGHAEEITRVNTIGEQTMFLVIDEADVTGCKYVNVLVEILKKPWEFLRECLHKKNDCVTNDEIPFLVFFLVRNKANYGHKILFCYFKPSSYTVTTCE